MHILTIQNDDFTEHFTLDFMAKSAQSSILYTKGNCKLLATVCVDQNPSKEDFLPLSVQYVQKSYAVGKIPGGFIKREGRLSDFEILTSRAIDRALRPFFPKYFKLPVHISVTVLSYDRRSDLQVLALNAASVVLYLAGFNFIKPSCAVRVGVENNTFVLNPDTNVLEKSALNLLVCGSFENILMLEMQGKSTQGLDEELVLEALEFSSNFINLHCQKQENIFAKHKKAFNFSCNFDAVSNIEHSLLSHKDILLESLELESKNQKSPKLSDLASEIAQKLGADFGLVLEVANNQRKNLFRELALNGSRISKRKFDELRDIEIYTNLLPHAHGSALFTRGQTQALVVSTLGGENDKENRELLGYALPGKESFTFHYNFAPFATGHADMVTGISRREIGHGNLAKKALQDSIIDKNKTIRLVSEILESNGSSSMASVCAGSLALNASGIETTSLIAGIAMGLIKDENQSVVLSDICSLEDTFGDIDCKIAGNEHFITAMQLDSKITNINLSDLALVLERARASRLKILKIMYNAKEQIIMNYDSLPAELNFNVASSALPLVIGSGGKTIKEVISHFGVSVDLDKEFGVIKIKSSSRSSALNAKDFILDLINKNEKSTYEINETISGVVSKITDFGVFVDLPRGGSGLLHISKIEHLDDSELGFLNVGNEITCKIFALNNGKISLDLV